MFGFPATPVTSSFTSVAQASELFFGLENNCLLRPALPISCPEILLTRVLERAAQKGTPIPDADARLRMTAALGTGSVTGTLCFQQTFYCNFQSLRACSRLTKISTSCQKRPSGLSSEHNPPHPQLLMLTGGTLAGSPGSSRQEH